MKRGTLVITVLVVMAMLFASCSNGLSENAEGEGGASTKAVKVELSLGGAAANIAQKIVELSGGANKNTYTYYYKATPKWTDNDTQGKTAGFVPIGYDNSNHNYEDEYSLGYFTPGYWKFDVEIRASDGTTVLYEGTEDNVSISNASVTVTVTMALKDTDPSVDPTGTVNIAVAVPYISAATTVTMTMDGNAIADITKTDNKTVTSTTDATPVTAAGWELFTKTVTPAPGNHTFVLTYKDDTRVVGGAAVAFTVMNGQTNLICGTIENGKYQIATLTLNYPEVNLDLTMNTTPNATTVGMDGSYTCAITDTTCDTYAWLINGVVDGDYTSYNYTLNTFEPGVYEICCIATKGDAIGHVSKTVTVTPPNGHINIVSKIGGTGANIKRATTGSSIECTPVNIPGAATSVKWYVKKDDGAYEEQTAGVDGSNVFTFDNTTSTTKTGTAGVYKVVCKAYNSGTTIGSGERTITITAAP